MTTPEAQARTLPALQRIVAVLLTLGLTSSAVAQHLPVPIGPHPRNPHYFEFRGRPTILITSAEHYGSLINLDFHWQEYLESLAVDGMNYTRVFAGSMIEGEQDIPWMKYNNTLAPPPGKLLAPWSRGKIPGYHNGGNKFNLDEWEEDYFTRLKRFVETASKKGIVVEVTLFGNQYGDSQWASSPLNAANNIQGVGGRWEDFLTLRDKNLTQRQEALVRVGKIIDSTSITLIDGDFEEEGSTGGLFSRPSGLGMRSGALRWQDGRGDHHQHRIQGTSRPTRRQRFTAA